MAILLYALVTILLIAFLYSFFIILQLALFNLIMLVVMGVSWYRLMHIMNAVVYRFLDNGRKKSFKRWIRQLKELPSIRRLAIEIQENDEGRWIEIHLNETAD